MSIQFNRVLMNDSTLSHNKNSNSPGCFVGDRRPRCQYNRGSPTLRTELPLLYGRSLLNIYVTARDRLKYPNRSIDVKISLYI